MVFNGSEDGGQKDGHEGEEGGGGGEGGKRFEGSRHGAGPGGDGDDEGEGEGAAGVIGHCV